MRFVQAFAILFTLLNLQIASAQTEAPRASNLYGSGVTSQLVAPTNADASWRPSPLQVAAVETTTKTYFAARDASRASDAYALMSPKQQQSIPWMAFAKILNDFNSKAGRVSTRHLRSVTWYKDAQQAGAGLFAAVDYSSTYENLALHCGYVVWQEQPNGSFLQLREEVNIIDKATMEKLNPNDFAKVRAQFRC